MWASNTVPLIDAEVKKHCVLWENQGGFQFSLIWKNLHFNNTFQKTSHLMIQLT